MVLGGNKKLQDNVFCLTEERNYFQSKYLEQISEISHLQNELANSKREIQKLRQEVMLVGGSTKGEDASTSTLQTTERQQPSESSASAASATSTGEVGDEGEVDVCSKTKNTTTTLDVKTKENEEEEEEKEEVYDVDGDESESCTTEEDEQEDEEEEDEKNKLRRDAEKLLQWADYRSSLTGRASSVSGGASMSSAASPSSSLNYQSQRSSFGVPRTIKSSSLVEEEDALSHAS